MSRNRISIEKSIKRICFWGASGFRKTTWALETTAALNKNGLNAFYVSEQAKDLLLRGYHQPTQEDQVHIGAAQFERELTAMRAYPIIVTDSPVHLASIYASYYGEDKQIPKILSDIAFLLDRIAPPLNIVLRAPTNYDSSNRWQNESEAKDVQNYILSYLLLNDIPYTISPSIQDIVEMVKKELSVDD